LAALKAIRQDVVDPAIASHSGRIVKTTGDGLLLEFPSVVNAVRCALEVQTALADRTNDVPEEGRIIFRIGINLGDIIVEGDDIFGDGVNVAARLQEIAPPGGICISNRVHEDVRDRLGTGFDDGGVRTLKNIARPVQVWNWRPDATVGPKLASRPTTLPLPDKPSIAVLPFQNMSGDQEQEYFVDGVTEEIITELSRFHSLFVIARNSSFSYKGRSPDVREVGRELGVRYVLEGSIRRASDRIRVTSQLIDTLTGNHIWAERYDRVLEDVFALQDDLTRAIVAVIAPQIESTEEAKAARRRPDNLSAYEIGRRAWVHAWQGHDKADRALLEQSIAEAKKALEIDPNSVMALHVLTWAYGSMLFLHMAENRDDAIRNATFASTRAIELDRMDAYGYSLRGLGVWQRGELERFPEALADARRGHELNPNDATVLRTLGILESSSGEPELAIKHLHELLRRNPRDPRCHQTYAILAGTSFVAKQYAEGVQKGIARAFGPASPNSGALTSRIVSDWDG
jgi:adenylate cyclase